MIENNGVQYQQTLMGCSSDSMDTIILLPIEVDTMIRDKKGRFVKCLTSEELKENIREQHKRWYFKNRERLLEQHREWKKNNPTKIKEEYRKYYQENKEYHWDKSNKWRKENPDKINEHRRLAYKKYPERYKSRWYAWKNKQRNFECLNCNSTKNLHFHHTNYEKKEGITLCRECHVKEHNNIKIN
ncbi:MAG: hypothetical protein AABY22_25275 [Nanoarchaeota archaeon]